MTGNFEDDTVTQFVTYWFSRVQHHDAIFNAYWSIAHSMSESFSLFFFNTACPTVSADCTVRVRGSPSSWAQTVQHFLYYGCFSFHIKCGDTIFDIAQANSRGSKSEHIYVALYLCGRRIWCNWTSPIQITLCIASSPILLNGSPFSLGGLGQKWNPCAFASIDHAVARYMHPEHSKCRDGEMSTGPDPLIELTRMLQEPHYTA